MNKVYLLLGSNLQDPVEQIYKAEKEIDNAIGKIDKKSSLYQTAAWGKRDQPDFINRVVVCTTNLSADQTLEKILDIEKKMGRRRTEKNSPRIIDIDILFFGRQIIDTGKLQIPHPLMADRRFVLTPLCELSPSFKHPVTKKTVRQMLEESSDPLDVKRI